MLNHAKVRPRRPTWHDVCQYLAIGIAALSAPFWVVFALGNYNWLGSLDSNGAALAGFGLAALSVVSAYRAAGIHVEPDPAFESDAVWGFGTAILVGWVVASVLLYSAKTELRRTE